MRFLLISILGSTIICATAAQAQQSWQGTHTHSLGSWQNQTLTTEDKLKHLSLEQAKYQMQLNNY